ncbi:hypothetical protein [Paenibacillus germinis]|nr:hypothetical protein [Paenibacillus germinis]
MRAMLHAFVQLLPSWKVFLCTVLAFVIPYSVNKINEILHKYGDPPWKK